MPEVDFGRYTIRRNPYASRIAREGIELVHEGPSARSLAEIPEVDFASVTVRRNVYRAAEDAMTKLRPGRPRRGEAQGPSQVRSLRLPVAAWTALDAEAARSGTTVHALLRLAITKLLRERGRTTRSR